MAEGHGLPCEQNELVTARKRAGNSRYATVEEYTTDTDHEQPRSKRCLVSHCSVSLNERFWRLEQQMCQELSILNFSLPVTHIYNPLVYAAEPHQCYLNSYATSKKRVMFFGMNPGPYGMAQTGVCDYYTRIPFYTSHSLSTIYHLLHYKDSIQPCLRLILLYLWLPTVHVLYHSLHFYV